MSKINLHEMMVPRMNDLVNKVEKLVIEDCKKLGKSADFTKQRIQLETTACRVGYTAALSDLQGKVDGLLKVVQFYTTENNIFTEWDENSGASYLQERNKISCYEDYGFTAKQALAEFKNGVENE